MDMTAVRAIKARLRQRRQEMVDLLRDLVRTPSYDGNIHEIAAFLGKRLVELGFEDVRTDPMGNLVGRIGNGPRTLLYDSHLDTVAVSEPEAWPWDPFEGRIADGVLYGLGAGDEKGSTPPMVYALAALKELGLAANWSLYYFGNIEEWCEGLSSRVFVEVEGLRPDFVVVGESTRLQVYRGHRGRAEYLVTVAGRAGHGSMPERADNAIYRALPMVQAIADLNNGRLPSDEALGPGTIAVTRIMAAGGSVNVIPDRCTFFIDRRLTVGETPGGALAQLRDLLPFAARIEIPVWSRPSYTGFVLEQPMVFPAWLMPDDHLLIRAARQAVEVGPGRPAETGRWAFSTNGTYWNGVQRIPTVGFGPGDETTAHTVHDSVPLQEVWDAADFYGVLPLALDDLA